MPAISETPPRQPDERSLLASCEPGDMYVWNLCDWAVVHGEHSGSRLPATDVAATDRALALQTCGVAARTIPVRSELVPDDQMTQELRVAKVQSPPVSARMGELKNSEGKHHVRGGKAGPPRRTLRVHDYVYTTDQPDAAPASAFRAVGEDKKRDPGHRMHPRDTEHHRMTLEGCGDPPRQVAADGSCRRNRCELAGTGSVAPHRSTISCLQKSSSGSSRTRSLP
jgi:hypothetical protein